LSEISAVLGRKLSLITDLSSPISWTEDGDTFAANALIKALAVRKHTDFDILADDSGLEVHALNLAPGVRSARYSGNGAKDSQNNEKLLRELGNQTDRRAAFVCALVYWEKEGVPQTFIGKLHGQIARSPRGAFGFGYDPLFIPDGFSESLAELGPETKNQISHRARALAKLKEYLGQSSRQLT
jgi:XTP/dITP diphosphohydrolase